MQSIDFLPTSYRESNHRRWDRWWQIGLFVAVGSTCAAASTLQLVVRSEVWNELDGLAERHAAAVAQEQRFNQLRTELSTAGQQAELITYLAHPWPKSQALAALFARLPDSVTLQDVRIARDASFRTIAEGAPRPRRSAMNAAQAAEEDAKVPPHQRDLQRLQTECDPARVVATLQGVTSDGSQLHEYIADLAHHELVAKAELMSLDSNVQRKPDEQGPKLSQFQARIVLKPGYGQPGGPSRTPEKSQELGARR